MTSPGLRLTYKGVTYFSKSLDPNWMLLGYVPRPYNKWSLFWHTFYHGMLMRHGFIRCLGFAFGVVINSKRVCAFFRGPTYLELYHSRQDGEAI